MIYFNISESSSKEKRKVHIFGIILLFDKKNAEDKNFFSETKS